MKTTICRALLPTLQPSLESSGFTLTEADASASEREHGIHQLEFRTKVRDKVVLLSICEVTNDRTVTAELWSPDDLRRLLPVESADAAAIERRTWKHVDGSDGRDLQGEIVGVVTSWVKALRTDLGMATRTVR